MGSYKDESVSMGLPLVGPALGCNPYLSTENQLYIPCEVTEFVLFEVAPKEQVNVKAK